jgi:hypothetical protein
LRTIKHGIAVDAPTQVDSFLGSITLRCKQAHFYQIKGKAKILHMLTKSPRVMGSQKKDPLIVERLDRTIMGEISDWH